MIRAGTRAPRASKAFTWQPRKCFERLRDGELDVHHAAVAQHQDEEAQLPAGIADIDRAVLAPVHLGGLSGLEVQRQERRRLVRAHLVHVLAHDADTAGEAVLAQALEDLRGAVGVVLEPLPDERLEGVELARARRRSAWSEGGFVEPEAYGLRVQGELSGDLGEVELVDPVERTHAIWWCGNHGIWWASVANRNDGSRVSHG